MKKSIRLAIVSGTVLVILLGSIYAFFMLPRGQELRDFSYVKDGITTPYKSGDILVPEDNDPLITTFYGWFDFDGGADISLLIKLPDVMAFEVYINGEKIYHIGDIEDPGTVVRNHVFSIPLESSLLQATNNEIKLVTSDKEGTLIDFIPTIHDYHEAIQISYYSNILLNNLFLIMIVFTILTNAMIYYLSRNTGNKKAFFNLVIVFTTLIILSTLQYYYFPIEFSILPFIWVKKIANMAMCLAIIVAYRLVHWDNPNKKKYYIMDIPLLLSAFSILLVPSYASFSIVITVHIAIIFISFIQLYYLIIKFRLGMFTPIIVIMLISTIEMVLCYFSIIPNLYLVYLAIGAIVINLYVLSYDYYNKILDEGMQDPLTKAYTRRYIDYYKFDKNTSIVFIDLDNFKKYNDSFSHQAGDILLQDLVHRFELLFHNTTKVVRYGGDEFILFIKNVSDEEITNQLLSLKQSICMEYAKVGYSFGITKYQNDLYESIHLADKKMYQNKVINKMKSN